MSARIVDVREATHPIASSIANAYIDFSKMTCSLVAVVTDVVRDGRRVRLEEDSGVPTWELSDEGTGTRVVFTLSGRDPERPPYPGWTGWLSAMSSLRRYHELDDWRPIWA